MSAANDLRQRLYVTSATAAPPRHPRTTVSLPRRRDAGKAAPEKERSPAVAGITPLAPAPPPPTLRSSPRPLSAPARQVVHSTPLGRPVVAAVNSALRPLHELRAALEELRHTGTTLPVGDLDAPDSVFHAIARMLAEDHPTPSVRGTTSLMDETHDYVYLKRRGCLAGQGDDPYDLVVVPSPPAGTADEYWTLSVRGLTQYSDGEAEFTPLHAWIREYLIFRRCFAIKFFVHFRRWRHFTIWHRSTRRESLSAAATLLSSTHFLLQPELQLAVMEIRRLCAQLEHDAASDFVLFDSLPAEVTLDVFVAAQAAHRRRTQHRLQQQQAVITGLIHDACKALDRTRTVREQGLHLAFGRIGGRAAPTRSYTEEARRRQLYKRIMGFLRMCDFMFSRALVCVAIHSLERAAAALNHAPHETRAVGSKRQAFAITVKADMDSSGRGDIAITPTQEVIQLAITEVVQAMLEVLYQLPRFVAHPAFRNYVEGATVDGLGASSPLSGVELRQIVTAERAHSASLRHINASVHASLEMVRVEVSALEPLARMARENAALRGERVRAADPTADWYREQLEAYRAQLTALDQVEPLARCGVLALDSRPLIATVRPTPLRCMDVIFELVPAIAREKNSLFLDEASQALTGLRKSPTSVQGFSAYVAHYTATVEHMPDIEREYESIRDLYALMDVEKDMELTADDQAQLASGTYRTMSQLRHHLHSFEERREHLIQRFAIDIQRTLTSLQEKCENIIARLESHMFADEASPPAECLRLLRNFADEHRSIVLREEEFCGYQQQFGLELSRVEDVAECGGRLTDLIRLWEGIAAWDEFVATSRGMPLSALDSGAFRARVDEFHSLVLLVARSLGSNCALLQLKLSVEEMRRVATVVEVLKNSNLQLHHIKRIDEIVRAKMPPTGPRERSVLDDEGFTFGTLFDLHLVDLSSELVAVSVAANQEALLEKELLELQLLWQGGQGQRGVEFACVAYKDMRDMFVIGPNVEEVNTIVEDALVRASALTSNRYCEGVLKVRATKLEDSIRLLAATLDRWVAFQASWVYLEAIFGQPEIAKQWPADEKAFRVADKFFRELMRRVAVMPNVHHNCTQRGLKEQLERGIGQLEKVQAALERKLEEKRQLFPRFYFLSNDDLIDVLAQVRTPVRVTPHLLKVFENIKNLHFDGFSITAMESGEGEVVRFDRPVKARGDVELWLMRVEEQMIATLRARLTTARKDARPACIHKGGGGEWLSRHPAQLVLAVDQVMWTASIEAAFGEEIRSVLQSEAHPLDPVMQTIQDELTSFSRLITSDLPLLRRALLSTLITLKVHMRDIVDELIVANVRSAGEFDWRKHLRAYTTAGDAASAVDGGDVLHLEQNGAVVPYGFEYLGCLGRLVMTPVTDRIYMTITGALRFCLGAAPAGPAGTGKTETVKDLAKNVGRQCIVFNCSDGVTYLMMQRLWAGLAQCGCWCCLDEFNRINVEVLSVIAAQLMELRAATLAGLTVIPFQGGDEITIRPTYGAFITMNPGYAGRTELPDNLKSLFRPVAVMTPDFRMIAEVILFAEGFESAKDLSRKITQLYKLSSEQLSPQDHYDFGMRALKSILVMAGALKREHPHAPEEVLLVRACYDSNVPKFVVDDVRLFRHILQDLFPTLELSAAENDDLTATASGVLAAAQLAVAEAQLRKIVQLYDIVALRFGTMLVGEAGTGKSTVRRTLCRSLTLLSDTAPTLAMAAPTQERLLNPKAVTYAQLFGALNPLTQEWTDGVLVRVVRDIIAEGAPKDPANSAGASVSKSTWIVLDGPVDTLWIESLNSVLDDSRLLCLDNGVRMKIPPSVRMLFEVGNLAHASPATVSRCGMVYFTPAADFSGRWVVQTFLEDVLPPLLGHDPVLVQHIVERCESALFAAIDFHEAKTTSLILSGCTQIAQHFCVLLEELCRRISGGLLDTTDVSHNPRWREVLNGVFIFALIWACGSNLSPGSLEAFDHFVRTELGEAAAPLPHYGLVTDFALDLTTFRFAQWGDGLQPPEIDTARPFFSHVVPTAHSHRLDWFASLLIPRGVPLLLTGENGVGKSTLLLHALRHVRDDQSLGFGLRLSPLQFSARTTAGRTQDSIESRLHTKRRRNVLGSPVAGTAVCFFVEDLNMPAPERFGACPSAELLRQLLDTHGFYDREKLHFKCVEDVRLVATAGRPEGGRHPLSSRLSRQFHIFELHQLPEDTVKKIFQRIFDAYVGGGVGFAVEVRMTLQGLVGATCELFAKMQDHFKPVPAKPHYDFSLRDLSKCVQGLTRAEPRVCTTSRTAASLWLHECSRCFGDRLTDDADRAAFNEAVMEVMRRHNLSAVERGNRHDGAQLPAVIWSDFHRHDGVFGALEPLTEIRQAARVFENAQARVGSDPSTHLILFPYCCMHLCRIVRVLRLARGNALLVGVAGCGKRSLATLAATVAQLAVVRPRSSARSDATGFRESLVEAYVGSFQHPTAFIVGDTDIVDDGVLEDLSIALNSGDVPGLFTAEQREGIINDSTPDALQAGVTSRDEIFQHFLAGVRDRLRVVLCLSPIGDSFRSRCRQFPALVNCCTINWLDPWPREALVAVVERRWSAIAMDAAGTALWDAPTAAALLAAVHQAAGAAATAFSGSMFVTPAMFLELVDLFARVLAVQRSQLLSHRARMDTGVQQMRAANVQVAAMEGRVREMEPLLQRQRNEVECLVADISIRARASQEVASLVQGQRALAQEEERVAASIKQEAERDLAEALPELEAAVGALRALQKSDIDEIKKYTTPTRAVSTTIEAVLTLLSEPRPGDWGSAKSVLGNPKFMERLLTFDVAQLTDATIARMQKFVRDSEFRPEKVGSAGSGACRSLCMWALAMEHYFHVYRRVDPKRKALAVAEENAAAAQLSLRAAEEKLASAEQELAEHRGRLAAAEQEQAALQEELDRTKRRITAAGSLTRSLSGELDRWAAAMEATAHQMVRLPTTSLLVAAFTLYCGPLPPTQRSDLRAAWCAVLDRCQDVAGVDVDAASVDPVARMFSPSQVREWHLNTLPNDTYSEENAAIASLLQSARYPYFIDPQGQARRWIVATEAARKLRTVSADDAKLLVHVRHAVVMGTPLLIEKVGATLPPALDNLLVQRFTNVEGRTVLSLGTETVDVSPDFRLYLVADGMNPRLLPETFVSMRVINFAITTAGLEDQILSDIVLIERADVEEQRQRNVRTIADSKSQLDGLEERVLRLISEGKGNILDNVALIDDLQRAHQLATELQTKVKEVERHTAQLVAERNRFREVAARFAVLHTAVDALRGCDAVYCFDLDALKRLCLGVVADGQGWRTHGCAQHTVELQRAITEHIFERISWGLFSPHRLLFALLVVSAVQRHQEGLFGRDEWVLFLHGPSTSDANAVPRTPRPDALATWIPHAVWAALDRLDARTPTMRGIVQHITDNDGAWAQWLAAPTLSSLHLPFDDESTQNDHPNTRPTTLLAAPAFHRALLIRLLRPSCTADAVEQLVRRFPATLDFSEAPLARILAASTPFRPTMFLLSQGTDPVPYFLRFAAERRPVGEVLTVSLGQGQEEKATAAFSTGSRSGRWVLLQNCHLSRRFTAQLDDLVHELVAQEGARHPTVNLDFRLWLTTMPAPHLPSRLLLAALKVASQAPTGLRSHLQRCLSQLPSGELDGAAETPPSRVARLRRLALRLGCFHAALLERRQFGSIGWNARYEFSDADFTVALRSLKELALDEAAPGWQALLHIVGVIHYGGRVTDSWDMVTLRAMLDMYLGPDAIAEAGNEMESGMGSGAAATHDPLFALPPNATTVAMMIDHVNAHCGDPDPVERFGLDRRAANTRQAHRSRLLLHHIRAVGSGASSVGDLSGISDDALRTCVCDLSAALPSPLSLDGVVDCGDADDPLNTVLAHEVGRYNKLLAVIRGTLTEMHRAIDGLVILSAELERIVVDLYTNTVPGPWAAAAFTSNKRLASWMADLVARVDFFRAWLRFGEPSVAWIGAFFYPHGFFTAVLQRAARSTKRPIDALSLAFTVLPASSADLAAATRPTEGVIVSGLYCDGFRWDDRDGVMDVSAESVVDDTGGQAPPPMLPPLHVVPRENYRARGCYVCPLYKTSDRAGVLSSLGTSTNFVVAVDLPTRHPPAMWTKRGAALLSMLPDDA